LIDEEKQLPEIINSVIPTEAKRSGGNLKTVVVVKDGIPYRPAELCSELGVLP
jgi:hypothetical protein